VSVELGTPAPGAELDSARRRARFERLQRLIDRGVTPVISVLLGLAVGAIAIGWAHESVSGAYSALVQGVTGSPYSLSIWLERATPIALVALGTAVAFRAGLFNIGEPGQLVCGAFTSAMVGLELPFHGVPNIVLALAAGAAAGAVAGLIPGLLEGRFGVTLVVSTLLLNYVFETIFSYLVSGPLRDTTGTSQLPQTRMLTAADRLQPFSATTQFHAGMLLALVITVLLALAVRYSGWGFELRMRGLNPSFALVGGVDLARQTAQVMAVSGALCGLGGAVATLATYGRYIDGALTNPDVGFTGLAAALMAGSSVVASVVAALFLAFLQAGATAMSRTTNVPLQLADVIQGTIIVLVTARIGVGFLVRLRSRRNGARS